MQCLCNCPSMQSGRTVHLPSSLGSCTDTPQYEIGLSPHSSLPKNRTYSLLRWVSTVGVNSRNERIECAHPMGVFSVFFGRVDRKYIEIMLVIKYNTNLPKRVKMSWKWLQNSKIFPAVRELPFPAHAEQNLPIWSMKRRIQLAFRICRREPLTLNLREVMTWIRFS